MLIEYYSTWYVQTSEDTYDTVSAHPRRGVGKTKTRFSSETDIASIWTMAAEGSRYTSVFVSRTKVYRNNKRLQTTKETFGKPDVERM